jgi:hypothetical protein
MLVKLGATSCEVHALTWLGHYSFGCHARQGMVGIANLQCYTCLHAHEVSGGMAPHAYVLPHTCCMQVILLGQGGESEDVSKARSHSVMTSTSSHLGWFPAVAIATFLWQHAILHVLDMICLLTDWHYWHRCVVTVIQSYMRGTTWGWVLWDSHHCRAVCGLGVGTATNINVGVGTASKTVAAMPRQA